MKLLIVCYHYIKNPDNPYLNRGVALSEFERQIEELRKEYRIVSFSDLPHLKDDENVCIVTFDDGMKELYSHVFPVINKHEVDITVFICSQVFTEGTVLDVQKQHVLQSVLGKDVFLERFYEELNVLYPDVRRDATDDDYASIYPYDEESVRQFKLDLNYRLPIETVSQVIGALFQAVYADDGAGVVEKVYMDRKEMQEMHASGLVEFGAHTHSHYMLSRLSRDDQETQIRKSVDFISSEFAVNQVPFSFPFGRKGTYTEETIELLSKDERINFACTMQRQYNSSIDKRYEVHRFDVNDIFKKEAL